MCRNQKKLRFTESRLAMLVHNNTAASSWLGSNSGSNSGNSSFNLLDPTLSLGDPLADLPDDVEGGGDAGRDRPR